MPTKEIILVERRGDNAIPDASKSNHKVVAQDGKKLVDRSDSLMEVTSKAGDISGADANSNDRGSNSIVGGICRHGGCEEVVVRNGGEFRRGEGRPTLKIKSVLPNININMAAKANNKCDKRAEDIRAKNRERKARSRANQTKEKKAEEREIARAAMAKKRLTATPAQKAAMNARSAAYMRKLRMNLANEEAAHRLAQENERKIKKRQKETTEERSNRLARERERRQKKRAEETEEERLNRLVIDRERKKKRRREEKLERDAALFLDFAGCLGRRVEATSAPKVKSECN